MAAPDQMNWQLENAQRALLARRQAAVKKPTTGGAFFWSLPDQAPAAEPEQTAVSFHPDVALAAQRAGLSCHYQLWLILRHQDRSGCGRVILADIKKKTSYKWPRLRQLLIEGNGRFWSYDASRTAVYYTAVHHVAAAMGLERLSGRFVSIKGEHLYSSLKRFRAHLFAGWLANRDNPITQETIHQLTGISPRTQLRYCKLARVERQNNLAIGPEWRPETAQECAWHHPSAFSFVDFHGHQGKTGRRYVAWHLPSRYLVTVARASKRRTKRVNGRLILVKTGTRGNEAAAPQRVFYHHGKAAARALSQSTDQHDVYFYGRRARSGVGLWHALQ